MATSRAKYRVELITDDGRKLSDHLERATPLGALPTLRRLVTVLAGVSEPERLTAVGNAIIDCSTGAELLAAARRIVSTAN